MVDLTGAAAGPVRAEGGVTGPVQRLLRTFTRDHQGTAVQEPGLATDQRVMTSILRMALHHLSRRSAIIRGKRPRSPGGPLPQDRPTSPSVSS